MHTIIVIMITLIAIVIGLVDTHTPYHSSTRVSPESIIPIVITDSYHNNDDSMCGPQVNNNKFLGMDHFEEILKSH